MSVENYKFLLICLIFAMKVDARRIGSPRWASQYYKKIVFAARQKNYIQGATYLRAGFDLQDSTASCYFEGTDGISGAIDLKGGKFYLRRNLILDSGSQIKTCGNIYGSNLMILFNENIYKWLIPYTSSTETFLFDNVNLLLRDDIFFQAPIKFSGMCAIEGRNNFISLEDDNAEIVVDYNTTLHLKNIRVKNISGEKIRCLDSTSKLVLENVDWIQADKSEFSNGSFDVKGKLRITGDNIFAYTTDQESRILTQSSLVLDDAITFSYDPSSESKNLIVFEDKTAKLVLKGAEFYTTSTGISLTKGKCIIKENSTFTSEVEDLGDEIFCGGITLGNNTSEDDFKLKIGSGVRLIISKGKFNYKNILNSSWKMGSYNSIFHINSEVELNLYENLNLGLGITEFEGNSILGLLSNKSIIGSISPLGNIIRKEL